MPYITSIEQSGIQKGILQGTLQTAKESVIEVLETRFENVPDFLTLRLTEIKDLTRLKQLHKRAIIVNSLEEFQQLLTDSET